MWSLVITPSPSTIPASPSVPASLLIATIESRIKRSVKTHHPAHDQRIKSKHSSLLLHHHQLLLLLQKLFVLKLLLLLDGWIIFTGLWFYERKG